MVSNVSGGRPDGASLLSLDFGSESFTDPALALLQLESEADVNERANSRLDIHDAAARMSEAREQLRKAKEEAKKQQEEAASWGIFSGDLSSIATIAGGVAAIAATGGAAATIIAAGAATKIGAKIAKDEGIIGDKVARVLDVAGTLAMTGASVAGAGSAASATGRAIVAGAKTIDVTASAGQAGADYMSKTAEAASVEASGRAEAHRAERDVAQGHLERATDNYGKSAEHGRNTAKQIASIVNDENEAKLGIIQNYVRG